MWAAIEVAWPKTREPTARARHWVEFKVRLDLGTSGSVAGEVDPACADHDEVSPGTNTWTHVISLASSASKMPNKEGAVSITLTMFP